MKNNKYLFVTNNIKSAYYDVFETLFNFSRELLDKINMQTRVPNPCEYVVIKRTEAYCKHFLFIIYFLNKCDLSFDYTNNLIYVFLTKQSCENYLKRRTEILCNNGIYPD